MFTVSCTLYSVCMFTVSCTLYSVCMFTVSCTLYSVCMFTVSCTLYSVCMFTVSCTLYSVFTQQIAESLGDGTRTPLQVDVEKYLFGEKGHLLPFYTETLIAWFEFCTQLG